MNRRELLAAGAAALVPLSATATVPVAKTVKQDWPTGRELTAFAEERSRWEQIHRDIHRHVPIVATDDTKLRWDSFQVPNNSSDPTAQLSIAGGVFVVQYEADPTPYENFIRLTPDERAGIRRGTLSAREVVFEKAQILVTARHDRIEATCWERFTRRTREACRPWAWPESDPLGDLNPHGRWKGTPDQGRNPHVRYDHTAVAYANSTVTDAFLRRYGLSKPTGRQSNERYQAALDSQTMRANCPRLIRYDCGYIDGCGAFRPFVPDEVVVIFGRRITGVTGGVPVGEYRMTANANRPDLTGGPCTRFITVYDEGVLTGRLELATLRPGVRLAYPPEGVPAVQDNHNGGAVFWRDDDAVPLWVPGCSE